MPAWSTRTETEGGRGGRGCVCMWVSGREKAGEPNKGCQFSPTPLDVAVAAAAVVCRFPYLARCEWLLPRVHGRECLAQSRDDECDARRLDVELAVVQQADEPRRHADQIRGRTVRQLVQVAHDAKEVDVALVPPDRRNRTRADDESGRRERERRMKGRSASRRTGPTLRARACLSVEHAPPLPVFLPVPFVLT